MKTIPKSFWRVGLCLIACATLLSACASLDSVEPGGDADIAADVRARLADDMQLSRHLIGVRVEDGVVELSGTLRQSGDRARAVSIARGTTGVRAVVDRTTD